MFFRILKNDLRRKKSMNIILLIFVILSAMFASSSTYNMLAVYGGIDYFFEKADMPDYVAVTLNTGSNTAEGSARDSLNTGSNTAEGSARDSLNTGSNNPADEIVRNAPSMTSYKKEDIIYYSATDMSKDGASYVNFENPGLIVSDSGVKLNYFNKDNEVIAGVPEGHVYVGGLLRTSEDVHIGDMFELTIEDVTLNLTIDGYLKDALFGSPFIGNPRMIMNERDFAKLLAAENINAHTGGIYYVNTDDIEALKQDLSLISNALFAKETSVIKLTFMLDMLTAALLLVVSICLILIAFTMLSFTIKFTLSEDFREIGVMKAVGLKDRQIRGMYMVKYLCISVVGAVIGYFASLPFGNMLMLGIGERLLLGDEGGALVGIISACAVVLVVLWFCYFCTRRIKKLSPVDAVRSGETGERYHAKSVMRLSKSRLGSNVFLGINDVLSHPRQYMSMIITFTICLLLITMLANAANTLMSEKLIYLFGTTESDAYYSNSDKLMSAMGNEDDTVMPEIINDIENTLEENGMPADVHVELNYQIPVRFGDKCLQVMMQQCTSTKTTDYVYNEGLAPLYVNEIAFTPQILEALGAEIGDKVKLTIDGVESEYTITATFMSLNQLGEAGRLHQDVKTRSKDIASAFSFQIDFKDNPGDEEIAARIEKMRDIFDTENVLSVREFVDKCTNSSETVSMAKNLVFMIALLIAVLITVLMERSFLGKESSEIALMKAIGFKTRSICLQHTIRFAVVTVISAVIAGVIDRPFTKIVCDRIFGVMGAGSGIEYKIEPLEIFVFYPVVLAAFVSFAAWLTSLYARTIRADEMGDIE